jgi:nitroreductase
MSRVIELLRARHATRSISNQALPDEVVADLIEAARLAPSCFNKQPWRYLFLLSEEARAKGREALSKGNQPWAGRAPLLVIAHTRPEDDCQLPGRDYHQFDLGLSVMNLLLAATEHGLVARPMAGFDPAKASELFGLPAGAEPLVMLAIGQPASDEDHLADHYKGIADKPRERKPADQIVERL